MFCLVKNDYELGLYDLESEKVLPTVVSLNSTRTKERLRNTFGVYNIGINRYNAIEFVNPSCIFNTLMPKDYMKMALSGDSTSKELVSTITTLKCRGTLDDTNLPAKLDGVQACVLGSDDLFNLINFEYSNWRRTPEAKLSIKNSSLCLGDFAIAHVRNVNFYALDFVYLIEGKAWLIARDNNSDLVMIDLLEILETGNGVYRAKCSEDFELMCKDELVLV